MAKLNDYIFEPIAKDKIMLFKPIMKNLELIWRSLLPHALPVDREDQIKIDSIDDTNLDIIYDSSLEIYKNSKERISSLESKAFNLMTYISAITAILFFLIDKNINSLTKALAIFSLALLICALLISLRCIGIKTQKTLFIDSMFEFNDNSNPKSKNKKEISIDLINNALFNQCIADNTADILKASRILLFYGIIFSSITFFTFLLSNEEKETHKIQIVNSKYIDSVYTNYSNNKQLQIKEINIKLHTLENDIKKITKDSIK